MELGDRVRITTPGKYFNKTGMLVDYEELGNGSNIHCFWVVAITELIQPQIEEKYLEQIFPVKNTFDVLIDTKFIVNGEERFEIIKMTHFSKVILPAEQTVALELLKQKLITCDIKMLHTFGDSADIVFSAHTALNIVSMDFIEENK